LKFKDFLLAFSIFENGRKILGITKTSSKFENNNNVCKPSSSNDIEVLHGMRVLMMVWIISGHTYSFAMQWLFFRNPKQLQAAPQNLLSQVFANGTFSVDSFLFISGLLVTFVGLKQMSRLNGNFNIAQFYLHRYLRMTPLMMAIIAFTATLLKYISDGPAASDSTVMFDSWCRKNWWINALYLHNFINRENMCLSHSWYSAVDMQLFIATPLILIPLHRRPKIGLYIILATLLSSMLLTGGLTIFNHLPAVPYMSDVVSAEIMNKYYGMIYIKPYTRIGPYLIGMALGYLLYSKEGKEISLTRTQTVIGWTAAIIANLGVLFAMLPVNGGYRLPDVLAGIYSASSRVIWALSLAWVTYATTAGKGGPIGSFLSFKLWKPWSRLTYSAYLIHPVIMAIFYGSRHTTFEFSHFLMSYIALGNLILTYAVSFLLSIVFESPIISIEKLLTQSRGRSGSNTRVLGSRC
jgi:peptidoglycan/LPS O-acetylase OafA/YrhL